MAFPSGSAYFYVFVKPSIGGTTRNSLGSIDPIGIIIKNYISLKFKKKKLPRSIDPLGPQNIFIIIYFFIYVYLSGANITKDILLKNNLSV